MATISPWVPPKTPRENPQPVLRRKECEPRIAGVESGRDHECFKVQLESPVEKTVGKSRSQVTIQQVVVAVVVVH